MRVKTALSPFCHLKCALGKDSNHFLFPIEFSAACVFRHFDAHGVAGLFDPYFFTTALGFADPISPFAACLRIAQVNHAR